MVAAGNLGPGYRCHGCGKIYAYEEPMETGKVLDGTHDDGTSLEELDTRSVYGCHDGHPHRPIPCTIGEDDWDSISEVWECAACSSKYDDRDEAIECCVPETDE